MILYLDCSSGISGDMLVGALLSLAGARAADPGPLDDVLRPALAAAGIDPRLVQVEDVRRGGIAALAFRVADQPGFATFDELIMSLFASDLEQPVADAVASIAERMAAAEAEVHGRDEAHLHELSDVDTAVDLICAATLLARLAPELVVASPPALGDGEIETAHGLLSVPAPAVLSLLAGMPTAGGAPAVPAGETPAAALGELTTPTGAALLAHYAAAFGGVPAGRVERIGYGAGRREVPGRPNVLRAVLVDPAAAPEASGAGDLDAAVAAASPASFAGHGTGDHVVLEANIDDMTPELLAHAADSLRETGALDVWMSEALMKKGRPGVVLHVLAAAADRERLAAAVFAETTTFGLRVVWCDRVYSEERRESVKIGKLKVGVRLSYVDGKLATVSPEYDDVRRVAAAVGRPARVVYEAAQSAARTRFSGS
jgi:pyridinium-3,5-bisthiocarboxylic acid mononucleotide nickel chelatase